MLLDRLNWYWWWVGQVVQVVLWVQVVHKMVVVEVLLVVSGVVGVLV